MLTKATCSQGCDRKLKAKGLCEPCYKRQRRHGDCSIRRRNYSEYENNVIRDIYKSTTYFSELNLDHASTLLGRSVENIKAHAQVLGLTSQYIKQKLRKCCDCGQFYVGRIHSKYCSPKCGAINKYTNGRGGVREDLGIYVRSSWEANYARYLNLLKNLGWIVAWDYEPHRFRFTEEVEVNSYLPDFKVIFPDYATEWHEVKGWMSDRDELVLRRMFQQFPNEKVVLVGEVEYNNICNSIRDVVSLEYSG